MYSMYTLRHSSTAVARNSLSSPSRVPFFGMLLTHPRMKRVWVWLRTFTADESGKVRSFSHPIQKIRHVRKGKGLFPPTIKGKGMGGGTYLKFPLFHSGPIHFFPPLLFREKRKASNSRPSPVAERKRPWKKGR